MANADTVEKIKVRTDIKAPSMYNVIFMNDNSTSMEFVILCLETFFNHSPETAYELTLKIHNEDMAIVATLPFEIAEQKSIETVQLARKNKFPLQVRVEAES